MILFYICIPFMFVGMAIALLPVLLRSLRYDSEMKAGQIEDRDHARREAEFWHKMLGHTKVSHPVPAPELLSDAEIVRVGVPKENQVNVEPSVWKAPASG